MRGLPDQPYVPSSVQVWTDPLGRTWKRRGVRGVGVEAKRIRSAFRDEQIHVATWWAGDIEWPASTAAREAFVERCGELWPEMIQATEWRSIEDGSRLLLLEVNC